MSDSSVLAYFASAWLYHGFTAESGDIAGAARNFGRRVPEARRDLADELESLLGEQSDAGLARRLQRLGAAYAPPKKGQLRQELQAAVIALREPDLEA